MANSFETLVRAGAPAIEEPLFYRVAPDPRVGGLVVTIRRRKSFGSDVLATRRVDTRGTSSTVLAAVVAAMVDAYGEIDPVLSRDSTVDALIGDHHRTRRAAPGAHAAEATPDVVRPSTAPAPARVPLWAVPSTPETGA